jgi:hypothetical protein
MRWTENDGLFCPFDVKNRLHGIWYLSALIVQNT